MKNIYKFLTTLLISYYRSYKLLNLLGLKNKYLIGLVLIMSILYFIFRFQINYISANLIDFNPYIIKSHEFFSLKCLISISISLILGAYVTYLKYIFIIRFIALMKGIPYWYRVLRYYYEDRPPSPNGAVRPTALHRRREKAGAEGEGPTDSSFKTTMVLYLLLTFIFSLLLCLYINSTMTFINNINSELHNMIKYCSDVFSFILILFSLRVILKTKFQIEDAPVLYTRAIFILFLTLGPFIFFNFFVGKNIMEQLDPIVRMLIKRSTIDLTLSFGPYGGTFTGKNLRPEETTDSPSSRGVLGFSSTSSSAVASTSIPLNSSIPTATRIKINSFSDFEGLSYESKLSLRLLLNKEFKHFININHLNHVPYEKLMDYSNSPFLLEFYYYMYSHSPYLFSKVTFFNLTLNTAINLEIYPSIVKDPLTQKWRVPKWNHSEKELEPIAWNIRKMLLIKIDYAVDCYALEHRLKKTHPNWSNINKAIINNLNLNNNSRQEYLKWAEQLYGRARAARDLRTCHTNQLAANRNLDPSSRIKREIYKIEE